MNDTNNFLLFNKAELKRLTIKDISIAFPELKNIFESKAIVISNWLSSWIKTDFEIGNIQETNLLPRKAELAYHLGVSIGTIQNALRYLEDRGYVESKQGIGTMIKDWNKPQTAVRKLTSKRDICIELIKKYILDKKIRKGTKIPSSMIIASAIGASPNTTRLALEALCSIGILEHKFNSATDSNWILKSNNFSMPKSKLNLSSNVTLVQKIRKELEDYILKNLEVGDKLPAHEKLSKELKVSIKTIHDSLKFLIKDKILLARRGRYGTTVIRLPEEAQTKSKLSPKKETYIFASAPTTAFYNYEKTQNHIKTLIAENYEIGSKLPSILELSRELDLSPNTIRKALKNLSNEGYLRFSRGHYGGTFIIDIPDTSSKSFKWLAVNPKYAEVYKDMTTLSN